MMDSGSSQIFDLGDRKNYLPDESNDDNSFLDDELSTNMDLYIGEDDKCVGQSNRSLFLTNNASNEPYIGMEFNSRDDARDFYVAYGRRTGFSVRIHHNRRSRINNQVIGQDFVCSKEGFREKKYMQRKDRVLPPPPITREGCHAMLRVALKDGVKWVVTKFVKDHNHSLMPPNKVPWRGSGKNIISQVQLSKCFCDFMEEGCTTMIEAIGEPLEGVWFPPQVVYAVFHLFEDEKDQKIRELTLELQNERQRCKRRCAAYQEQLHSLLKYIEEHSDHLSRSIEEIAHRVKELEDEERDNSD